ncbi:MAG: N-acetylneuraminate synthase family protein [Planctomycetota bacterium]
MVVPKAKSKGLNPMQTDRVFVIAEAGVNHNGQLHLALELADAALAAGADAVKFQVFRTKDVVTPITQTATYQQVNANETSQFDMLRKLELSEADFYAIADHCKNIGIEFFATPFSLSAVDMLMGMGVRRMKLPSGEITHRQLVQYIARTGLPLLMSTGMCTLDEVRTAIRWINEAQPNGGKPSALTVLHCTSSYPASAESLNLRTILTLAKEMQCPVGYSDHSEGIEAALSAVALGATVLEKHLTLSRNMIGPDHAASCAPDEFTHMVKGIRLVEKMLGNGVKKPHVMEYNTRDVARRSITLTAERPAGHVLCAEDLEMRRPGTGIEPDAYERVLGSVLRVSLPAYTTLQWEMLDVVKQSVVSA